jgi:hypothetical protein
MSELEERKCRYCGVKFQPYVSNQWLCVVCFNDEIDYVFNNKANGVFWGLPPFKAADRKKAAEDRKRAAEDRKNNKGKSK